jgi:hypothetical protein
MMGLLSSMNSSSGLPAGKEPAGSAATGLGSAATGLGGMLDSPKDMQAYMQAYFAQMAGMQTMLTHLATSANAPQGEGVKEDSKDAIEDESMEPVKDASNDALAALVGAGAGAGVGPDAMLPAAYFQMMCAWMSQFQPATPTTSTAPKGQGTEAAPPPPPPPSGKDGKDEDGEDSASVAAAASVAADAAGCVDPNASATAFMPTMDLQALQSAAAMWQMMSGGISSFLGSLRLKASHTSSLRPHILVT